MKVKALIESLQGLDPDLTVLVRGWDGRVYVAEAALSVKYSHSVSGADVFDDALFGKRVMVLSDDDQATDAKRGVLLSEWSEK